MQDLERRQRCRRCVQCSLQFRHAGKPNGDSNRASHNATDGTAPPTEFRKSRSAALWRVGSARASDLTIKHDKTATGRPTGERRPATTEQTGGQHGHMPTRARPARSGRTPQRSPAELLPQTQRQRVSTPGSPSAIAGRANQGWEVFPRLPHNLWAPDIVCADDTREGHRRSTTFTPSNCMH